MISIQWIFGCIKGADELDVSVGIHPPGVGVGFDGVGGMCLGEPSQVQISDVRHWFFSTGSIDGHTTVTGCMVDCNKTDITERIQKVLMVA